MRIGAFIPAKGRHASLALSIKCLFMAGVSEVTVASESADDKAVAYACGAVCVHVNPGSPIPVATQQALYGLKSLGVDCCVSVGSDDYATKSVISKLAYTMDKHQFSGFKDSYICDTNGNFLWWPGYQKGKMKDRPIGPFSCFRVDALDEINWSIWNEHGSPWVTDGVAYERMKPFKKRFHRGGSVIVGKEPDAINGIDKFPDAIAKTTEEADRVLSEFHPRLRALLRSRIYG